MTLDKCSSSNQTGAASATRAVNTDPRRFDELMDMGKLDQRNALMLATIEGHLEAVQNVLALPSADAQATAVDRHGLNALMIAAKK